MSSSASPHRVNISIEAIVVSAEHNYVGHYGKDPGTSPGLHQKEVKLLAGLGIQGDRFCSGTVGHKKQITFFELETLDALSVHVGEAVAPERVRRNVFVRGIELNALVGRRFRVSLDAGGAALEPAEFEGSERCNPCFWMDTAVAAGAETFLTSRGGLRARILSGDLLRLGGAVLEWWE